VPFIRCSAWQPNRCHYPELEVSTMDFGSLVTAMATPFTPDGALDVAGVHKLVDHLIETGTTAIVAAGTTGESPTLTHEEKLTLFRAVVERSNGRVPVLAGTGSNNTAETVLLSKEAVETGVDGLLLVTPYYNKPSQAGLVKHFETVAAAVDLPIMLYNIPGRTSINLDVPSVMHLAQVTNIVALKESSWNFAYVLDVAARKPDDFWLYSGDDKLTLPILSVGGRGVVSVASHVVGPEMAEMIAAFQRGDHAAAAAWNARLLPVFDALFATTSPAPLKAALKAMDLPAGQVRLPLVDAPESVAQLVTGELQRLGKL
jgi:4-hydroxy-tetrahydrodipicolinate synthase